METGSPVLSALGISGIKRAICFGTEGGIQVGEALHITPDVYRTRQIFLKLTNDTHYNPTEEETFVAAFKDIRAKNSKRVLCAQALVVFKDFCIDALNLITTVACAAIGAIVFGLVSAIGNAVIYLIGGVALGALKIGLYLGSKVTSVPDIAEFRLYEWLFTPTVGMLEDSLLDGEHYDEMDPSFRVQTTWESQYATYEQEFDQWGELPERLYLDDEN